MNITSLFVAVFKAQKEKHTHTHTKTYTHTQQICDVVGKRIMSGIQPTGEVHIGNYLGAIKNWVNLSQICTNNNKMIISIVDLHAMTVPNKPSILRKNNFNMATTLLACGIDPSKVTLYWQSQVRHSTAKQ